MRRAGVGFNGGVEEMRIAILASHGGTNAQAVIDACADGRLAAQVVLVISNNSDAMAMQRAARAGIPTRHLSGATHPQPDELDAAIVGALDAARVDVVVLAGYMKRLGPRTVAAYSGRIVNVHPALLPRHGGQGMYGRRVHEAVIAAGDAVTGVTVHRVDEEYDRGEILAQREVAVEPGDSADTLAGRVLVAEHALLVEVLAALASARVSES